MSDPVLDMHLAAMNAVLANTVNPVYADRLSSYGLQNAYVPPAVAKLHKAQAMAADVRARRPEMQVRRIG